MKSRFVAAIAAVLFSLALPAVAATNATPAPTPPPTPAQAGSPKIPPSLGQDAIDELSNIVRGAFGWSNNESIGTVTYYRGYEMQVRQQLDRYREIRLHRGTVINPRGYTIKQGDTVDIRGTANSDGSLNADMITVRNH